jgi:hypothetical protein
MNRIAIVLALLCLAGSVGCQLQPVAEGGFTVGAHRGGLLLEMSIPDRYFVRGDTVPVTVVARNTADEDLTVRADSGALVYVWLWRHTGTAWEQVKRFPAAAVMAAREWKLPAGGSHKLAMNLDVTADWPTGEPLKLTAELNGRSDVRAAALVEAFATRQECDRAKAY